MSTLLAPVRRASETEIPVIDIAGLTAPWGADARAIAARILAACETAGFFYIAGHGVPTAQIDDLLDQARGFFDLPTDEKERIALVKSPYYRGYLPLDSKGYDKTRRGNKLESFNVQVDLPADHPDVLAGRPLRGPNQWPARPAGLRASVTGYYAAMDALSQRLLAAFAMGLGYAPDALDGHYRQPLTQLRLIHYPPQAGDLTEDNLGAAAHSDTGAFTILWQDDVGGLEVRLPSGEWVVAPPIPGTFVVNIGDMLKWWTNGRFASTPHRVVNRYGRERYSVPYFVNPDFDAVITPLPGCVDANHPRRFDDVQAGAFILDRFRKVWPTAGAV